MLNAADLDDISLSSQECHGTADVTGMEVRGAKLPTGCCIPKWLTVEDAGKADLDFSTVLASGHWHDVRMNPWWG